MRFAWQLPCLCKHQSIIARQNTLKQSVFYTIPLQVVFLYDRQDTGNKVSRRATIAGPQNIILGGKTIISSGAIIRGDLRRTGPGHAIVISLGRYCLIGDGCVIRSVICSIWIAFVAFREPNVTILTHGTSIMSILGRRIRHIVGLSITTLWK